MCKEKHSVYRDDYSFNHPLNVLQHIPSDKGDCGSLLNKYRLSEKKCCLASLSRIFFSPVDLIALI